MENRWLLNHKRNITSQRGEDGVLAKIFDVLDIQNGWCVDVGAYGKNLSNTYSLISNGWTGVLIEGDKERLNKLERYHRRANRAVYCICEYVSPTGPKSLDALLATTPMPKDFDLLSIDIDGLDYYVWQSLTAYSPLVVVIEFNSIVGFNDYLQSQKGKSGASLSMLTALGKQKGYELICATAFNAFFVRKEAFPKFRIKDNRHEKLWRPDKRDLTALPTTKRVVGFQSGHDVAYCILENGLPVVVEEAERITRKKMELGDGLKFFFDRNPKITNVDWFTFGNWGGRIEKRHRITADAKTEEAMYSILSPYVGRFSEFGHHLSHAANAFYTSPFNEALIVTMDGGGFEAGGVGTCFTIRRGKGTKLSTVKVFPDTEINLGGAWFHLTRDVFGLSVRAPKGDQAGTVMAMATLGKPRYVKLLKDFRQNLKKLRQFAERSEQDSFDVAASLQKYTEDEFVKAVKPYIAGYTNLCVSGGVALNCVLLGKIRKWFPNIKEIFCDPLPYDAGLALGSARYLWHHILGNPRTKNNVANQSAYLGRSYSRREVLAACKKFAGKIKPTNEKDVDVVNRLAKKQIVAIYGGGSENGRRALGNRSILADPRNNEMKTKINEKVKHRHWFRPVAPAILEEKVGGWFIDPIESPYMSFALKFKTDKKRIVPAVVHFDGTGRLQTVNRKLNPWFHEFLTKWENKTGIPILINTSFNDSEPIVETPEDALKCFLKTNIDCLYFYDFGLVITKK